MKPAHLTALCALVLLVPAHLHAQDRELTREHNGSLGFFLSLGTEYSAIVDADCVFCTGSSEGVRARSITGANSLLDLGGTMAIGQSGSELTLRGRLVFLSPARGESLLLGYRKYWGKDEIKTFVSAELMGTFRPVQTLGARAGFGAMWDFSPVMGLWLDAAGTFGFGYGRRFGGELSIGFQARSYLLE
ncbi:MAG: hypothetical protein HY901_28685 [Deltaproteobacteria bacterium]|nr:hypothetical protein [Deltaproteobacteria bacterium]